MPTGQEEARNRLLAKYSMKSREVWQEPASPWVRSSTSPVRFDKLDPWKVTTALIKRGVDKDIALWYRDYLTDRHAHLHIKGSSTTRRIEIGCPQGGVLSTILWNLESGIWNLESGIWPGTCSKAKASSVWDMQTMVVYWSLVGILRNSIVIWMKHWKDVGIGRRNMG